MKKTTAISHMLNDEHGEWDHPELVRLALDTVGEYGAVLEETASLALGRCEKRLPFPKSEIQAAIEFMLKILNNKESCLKLRKAYPKIARTIITDQYYNAMKVSYIELATFVSDNEGELCERASRLVVEGKIIEAISSSWYKKYNKISQRIEKEQSSMLKTLHQKFGKKG
jgi:hypothetical protein